MAATIQHQLSLINCTEAAVIQGIRPLDLGLPIDDHAATVKVIMLGLA
jgi:hypothetical protein